ncbi:YfjI family protein [Nocardia ignorata]
MVAEVATETQTDPAMAATSVLAVLAACAGGHVEAQIRTGWREPLCLYTVAVAEPGQRKSAVHAALTAPLSLAERQLVEKVMATKIETETCKQVAEKDAERAKNAVAAAKSSAERDQLTADAVSAAERAAAITVPVSPRLFADDVTPEALASLLAEQRGRIAILSAEGGVFDIIGGRYSKSVPNLDVWLKGHSGDAIRVDRKGRDPEYIERPALTVGLMVQPSVLSAIGRNGDFRGRGLLARVLYGLPESKLGTRDPRPAPVAAATRTAYSDLITGLALDLAARDDEHGAMVLPFDPAADDAVCELQAEIEPQLGPDGKLACVVDWASKYVGAVVRIAGLLHLAEYGQSGAVSADTFARATAIGEYYCACAVAAFDTMQVDETTTAAINLAARLTEWDAEDISLRDLQRRGGFRTRADLEPALSRLVDNEYLRPLPQPEGTTGRPPSPRYAINDLWPPRRAYLTDTGGPSAA